VAAAGLIGQQEKAGGPQVEISVVQVVPVVRSKPIQRVGCRHVKGACSWQFEHGFAPVRTRRVGRSGLIEGAVAGGDKHVAG